MVSMKAKLTIAALLIPIIALSAPFAVFFDPNSTPVANRVTGFRESVNDLEYQGRPDALLLDALPSVNLKQAKVEGQLVMPLSQSDSNLIALTIWIAASNSVVQADANLRTAAKRAIQSELNEQALALRAMALTMLDEINALRAQHGLAPRTAAQLRNAIQAKIDDKTADGF